MSEFNADTDGQCLVIRGPSGAGKTILARAICGGYRESAVFVASGLVRLSDHELTMPEGPPQDLRIGYVPQDPSAAFVCTRVGDEVAMVAMTTCSTPSAADVLQAAWMERSPLAKLGNRDPLSLSGGERRLFAIEITALSNPDHLVIDGGFEALDSEFQERARDILNGWLAGNVGRRLIVFENDEGVSLPLSSRQSVVHLAQKPDHHRPQRLAIRRARVATPCSAKSAPLLSFEGVNGAPDDNRDLIIRDATFEVVPGDIVGISGANGAGKSTLLRLISGVQPLVAGKIKFRGESIFDQDWPGLEGGVAYLPQEVELAGPLAVAGVSSKRQAEADAAGTLKSWCDILEFEWDGLASSFWTMSAGERAKACLAVQAAANPVLWLIDEPTMRLTSATFLNFLAALRLRRPEIAMLIVSHDSSLLDGIAKIRLRLVRGEPLHVGT